MKVKAPVKIESYKGITIFFSEGSEYPYSHKCMSELAKIGFNSTAYKTLELAKAGIDKCKK